MIFYVCSTVFVWIEAIFHQIYLDRRLKKEGYKFTANKYFGLFDIILALLIIIVHSIPIFNLIFPIMHINKDRSYDEYMNYLDEAGAIEKVEELINKKEINVITVNDSKLIERTNSSGHIYYSPINRYDDNNIIEENGKVYIKKL